MSALDWFIIIGYLLGMIGLSVYLGRWQKTALVFWSILRAVFFSICFCGSPPRVFIGCGGNVDKPNDETCRKQRYQGLCVGPEDGAQA